MLAGDKKYPKSGLFCSTDLNAVYQRTGYPSMLKRFLQLPKVNLVLPPQSSTKAFKRSSFRGELKRETSARAKTRMQKKHRNWGRNSKEPPVLEHSNLSIIPPVKMRALSKILFLRFRADCQEQAKSLMPLGRRACFRCENYSVGSAPGSDGADSQSADSFPVSPGSRVLQRSFLFPARLANKYRL
jgi:hypothetical protein